MKFLSKRSDSDILAENLRYLRNNAANNKLLRDILLDKQRSFCAYTEKYITSIDTVEVDHINTGIKYADNYYNYYTVLRNANLYKQDEKYSGASFFMNLFFQNKEHFQSRIRYVRNEFIYEEVNLTDTEAIDFIDFLGLNDHQIYSARFKHIRRLARIFDDTGYDIHGKMNYFRMHNEELNYVTVIEAEFGLDLSEFYL